MPAKCPVALSQEKPDVTGGHSRALADVPSVGASAHRTRLVQADPNASDPL
jgi:hypothetical protein